MTGQPPPPASGTAADQSTVSPAGITLLAGVGRAALSNWRRQFPDFSARVGGTDAHPLFPLDAVEAWLKNHEKGVGP